MSGTVVVTIPPKKLGLVFTGKEKAVLQRITPDGPMDGVSIKPGYYVSEFIAANGEKTPSPSKKDLMGLLKETEDHTGRKLKFQIAFKDELEVELPASSELGFEIKDKGGVPIIGKIEPTCVLKQSISRGQVVDNITTDDFSMSGQGALEINALLAKTSAVSGRKLTLKAPKSELSALSVDYEEKVFNLPVNEDLGITWAGAIATVASVAESSPFFGEIYPGMICGATRIPDGRQIEYCSGNTLTQILEESVNDEGRLLLFPSTESVGDQEPLLKYYVSALGLNTDEIGCKVTEEDGKLFLAEEFSNGVPAGMELMSFNVIKPKGEESMEITSKEGLDSMLEETSGLQRFIVFTGLDSKYMPNEVSCLLPPGALGATLKGSNDCTVMKIKPTSPLYQTAATTGMIVASLMVDGETILTNPSTSEVIAALKENIGSDSRMIKLINPAKF